MRRNAVLCRELKYASANAVCARRSQTTCFVCDTSYWRARRGSQADAYTLSYWHVPEAPAGVASSNGLLKYPQSCFWLLQQIKKKTHGISMPETWPQHTYFYVCRHDSDPFKPHSTHHHPPTIPSPCLGDVRCGPTPRPYTSTSTSTSTGTSTLVQTLE